jgi:adenosylcobinamide-GDP ribazoletransferase
VVPVGAVVVGAMGLAAGHYAMRRRFEQRLGGYTGDCLGAVQQCSEIGFLLGVLAVI